MQPTMIEMIVEEQRQELERKRQLNHARELKPSRKSYRELLGKLFKVR